MQLSIFLWSNQNILIIYSLMVYYPLRDRELFGSNPLGALSHKRILTANLCDAPHIKSLSKGNNASAYIKAKGLRLTMLQLHLYQY